MSGIDREQLEEALLSIPKHHRDLVQFIHEQDVCTIPQITENFSALIEEFDSCVLSMIAVVNSKLWTKVRMTLYPVEITGDLNECAYKLIKEERP